MIRNIVIKTEIEQIVMRLRAQPFATPSQVLAAMNACLEDFKRECPDKYKLALSPEGVLNYNCLYTHVPQHILDRYKLDFVDCGGIWLEIEDNPNIE